MKNNQAIAILRVSSGTQERKISLEQQEETVQNYCNINSLKIIKSYRIVESAWHSAQRTTYKEALNFALSEGIFNIVFYIDDREARNLTDIEYNSDLVKEGVIEIHYARENKVFTKNSPDSDFLLRDLHGVINRDFSRRVSTKVRDGQLAKSNLSKYPFSSLPLGYVWGRKTKGHVADIKISPNESHLSQIRMTFKMKSEGYTLSQICHAIYNNFGVENSTSVIYHRVNNPLYYGKYWFHGELKDGDHPIIIDNDVLKKVASMNREKKLRHRKKCSIDSTGFIFGDKDLKPFCMEKSDMINFTTFRKKCREIVKNYRWSELQQKRVDKNEYYDKNKREKLYRFQIPKDDILCQKYMDIQSQS